MTIFFPQEHQMKTFVKNFLSSKAAECYLGVIQTLPEKWHK